MSNFARSRTTSLRFLALLVGGGLLATAAAASTEERVTFSGDHLKIRNVIGEIRIEGHAGSSFDVEVRVMGRDAAPDRILLEQGDDHLNVRFPEDVSDYVYPPMGKNESLTIRSKDDEGWFSEMIGNVLGTGRVRVRGSGSGTELWADLTVRVPRGARLEIEHGVGKVEVEGVDAELELATRIGDIDVDGVTERLEVATGSGSVQVARATGDRSSVATGSGDVKIDDADGERMQVATGSGNISVISARGQSLQLASGSGDIQAERISADGVEIGTGSGDVKLALDAMGRGDYEVGSGSGDITLTLPPGASADVRAETDRGNIDVALGSEVTYRTKEEDEVELTIGGGEARVELGSGSGDITIRD